MCGANLCTCLSCLCITLIESHLLEYKSPGKEKVDGHCCTVCSFSMKLLLSGRGTRKARNYTH